MACTRRLHRASHLLAMLGALIAGVALLLGACLDGLDRDPMVAGITEAAASALPAPMRKSRPHWFLRQEPGWVSAHHAEFGGMADDKVVTVIRVALFTDVAAADTAFDHLTPSSLYRLWHSQMATAPTAVAYPFDFAGDAVQTLEYRPRPSPGKDETGLTVQLILLHSGRTVIAIESLGVPRDHLPHIAAALVAAVHRFGSDTSDRPGLQGTLP